MIIIFNDKMNQQQIQLRFLHEKHIDNMLKLERQRKLLNKENPYKQTFFQEHSYSKPINNTQLPLLNPDPLIEKLLYYPPSHLEGTIANKAIDIILNSWNSECKNFPNNIHVEKMLKYEKSLNFDQMLGRRGREAVDEMLKHAKKHYITRPQVTIKQKYGQNYRGSFLRDGPLRGKAPSAVQQS